MILKSKIAELRKKAGFSQAQLGVFVGVSTNTIQNWEKPDGLAQLEKYLKLAEVLGVGKMIDLFEIEDTNEQSNQQVTKVGEFSIQELQKLREGWGITNSSDKQEHSLEKAKDDRYSSNEQDVAKCD